MWIFYLFATFAVLQSLIALRGGFRFRRYFKDELKRSPSGFTPFASVIAPCKGLDQGLQENLSALLKQNYPEWEILFVVESKDDPGLFAIEKVLAGLGSSVPITRIVISGSAHDSGQKVQNLRAGAAGVDPRSEVLVFYDSDVRPGKGWLRALVEPLAHDNVGAATGYRWFVPVRGNLASHLRSVWNASIASALGESTKSNFCWGGSTAIRKETFDKLQVAEAWRGTLADDFSLTRVLRKAGLGIKFVPQCLVPSLEDCSFSHLLEFTTRQIKITRVYSPDLWKVVLFSNLLFTCVFFGGLGIVAARLALGLPVLVPIALLIVIYVLGTLKALLRWNAACLVLTEYQKSMKSGLWAHLMLWPFTSALFLYNALAAALSRRIRWRGIEYELKSPNETVIIGRSKTDTIASVEESANA